jgi:hypothetical protein
LAKHIRAPSLTTILRGNARWPRLRRWADLRCLKNRRLSPTAAKAYDRHEIKKR